MIVIQIYDKGNSHCQICHFCVVGYLDLRKTLLSCAEESPYRHKMMVVHPKFPQKQQPHFSQNVTQEFHMYTINTCHFCLRSEYHCDIDRCFRLALCTFTSRQTCLEKEKFYITTSLLFNSLSHCFVLELIYSLKLPQIIVHYYRIKKLFIKYVLCKRERCMKSIVRIYKACQACRFLLRNQESD